MKFVLFYESEDLVEEQKKMKRFDEVWKNLAKERDVTMKPITPPFAYPDLTGAIQLVEAENIEDIIALVSYYYDVGRFSVQPIVEMEQALEVFNKVSEL
ncbi:hypothetical protein EU537_01960 [Candidatus Thorarchaeota archaeon]|nr:MAG: hypothetical protein EU537_01960 [Candidatus Thorarchaeota archaeon]